MAVNPATEEHRREVRYFLTSRRARLSPEEAGLSAYGDNRRVPGLRREEVAILAGVSTVYYTRVERGNLVGVSESVLDSIAKALLLTDAEREHLFDLARTANAGGSARARSRVGAARQRIPAGIQGVLDAITDAPADVRNGRRDILASNRLGRALYSDLYTDPGRTPNAARFTFLNPKAKEFFVDWEGAASDIVANLRAEAGRHPYDTQLSGLVGELSTRSHEFRVRWAAHNVRRHSSGKKRVHHALVGEIELSYQALSLPGDDSLSLIVYTVEPGSPSQEALGFLASWAETHLEVTERAESVRENHR